MNVLLVDDDEDHRRTWRKILAKEELDLDEASTGAAALSKYQKVYHSLVITDWKLGDDGLDGVELAGRVKNCAEGRGRFVYVILVTGAHPDRLLVALTKGADEFVTKTEVATQLLARVRVGCRLVEKVDRLILLGRQLVECAHANAALSKDLDRYTSVNDFLTDSGELVTNSTNPEMLKALETVKRVAPSDSTVLLLGETGTGKEVLARITHKLSKRKDKAFVPVNCATFPENLVESELFGHEKGAFTDAAHQRRGRFEQANGGTLFLDEVGDLPLAMQAKLLRVLEEQRCQRVGGENSITVDVRMIAATRWNLEELMRAGKFREDLYYRLNVISISLPPLRERPEDIPTLAANFVRKLAPRKKLQISPSAMDLLCRYRWPGNIRQLRNAIERALLFAGETIGPEHLPPEIQPQPERAGLTHDVSPCNAAIGPNPAGGFDPATFLQGLPKVLEEFFTPDGIRFKEAIQRFEAAILGAIYQVPDWKVPRKACFLGLPEGQFEYRRKKFLKQDRRGPNGKAGQ